MENEQKIIYDPAQDADYRNPVIDRREKRIRRTVDGRELPFLYLHGKFEGTNVKFTFCFPEKEVYGYHFLQHVSPFPGPDEEDAAMAHTGGDDLVAFALAHGFAYVESNMGSAEVFGRVDDATIFYKSNAAVAFYCRQVSRKLFGERRVYGYVCGGSGGGYKTMSCIENTNAFDGALPFVIGSPVSLPNCVTTWVNGMRTLRHCWHKIADAAEPGGSGDLYAGLTEQEQKDLREFVRMGIPPRVLTSAAAPDEGSLPVLLPVVQQADPSYFIDFWTQPGYPGADPDSSSVKDRIYLHTRVVGVRLAGEKQAGSADQNSADGRNGTDDAYRKMLSGGGEGALEVETVPEGEDLYLAGVDIVFLSGKAKGKRLRLGRIEGKELIPGPGYGCVDFSAIAAQIEPGDEILLDNSDYVAVQSYHRHQIPDDPSFPCFDQFRGGDGKPLYPQRDQVISFGFTYSGCGSVQDGHIQGKTIIMNNLMDPDFPWQADWYRRKIEAVNGTKAKDLVRLYYNDNAPHGDVSEMEDDGHLVSYLGMLRQALLDLAAWVENGTEPPQTSGYTLEDNQIILADTAEKRQGLQPLVTLTANGEKCAHVKPGQTVILRAAVETVPDGGTFEDAEICFDDKEGSFTREGQTVQECTREGRHFTEVSAAHTYETPGTYFAVVRVAANRTKGDPYTRLLNLDRVRIVVEDERKIL